METKVCRSCNKEWDIREFVYLPAAGFSADCKKCLDARGVRPIRAWEEDWVAEGEELFIKDSFRIGEVYDPTRMKLAAQAPAMVRRLLKLLERNRDPDFWMNEGGQWSDFEAGLRAELRGAGVIP